MPTLRTYQVTYIARIERVVRADQALAELKLLANGMRDWIDFESFAIDAGEGYPATSEQMVRICCRRTIEEEVTSSYGEAGAVVAFLDARHTLLPDGRFDPRDMTVTEIRTVDPEHYVLAALAEALSGPDEE